MDVRISYGIDINEVPKMIHKLLNNAGDAVDRAVSDSQMILKGYINTKNQREEAPTVAPATGESNVD